MSSESRSRMNREMAYALWLRYQAGETQTQLADEIGVTRQRISQIFMAYGLGRLVPPAQESTNR